MNKKTYVVINHYIVNDEVLELAKQTIESFRRTSDAIIVGVDDKSPQDTSELKEMSDVWIESEKNGGFAVSANKGIQYVLDHCKDCYIVYSNNDIEVYGDWHKTFVEMMNDIGADMIGGLGYRTKDIPNDNWLDWSEGGLYRDWMFPGGFYFTTDRFFREVGLYDEGYKHGGVEDIDLFWRAKNQEKKLVITPRVKYWHKEGATRYSDGEKNKQSDAILKNEAYFEKKWGFHPIKRMSKILVDNRFTL